MSVGRMAGDASGRRRRVPLDSDPCAAVKGVAGLTTGDVMVRRIFRCVGRCMAVCANTLHVFVPEGA